MKRCSARLFWQGGRGTTPYLMQLARLLLHREHLCARLKESDVVEGLSDQKEPPMKYTRFSTSILLLVCLALMPACTKNQKDAESVQDGPMEEAGEWTDDAAEDTGDAAEDLADETEEAFDEAGDDIEDAE